MKSVWSKLESEFGKSLSNNEKKFLIQNFLQNKKIETKFSEIFFFISQEKSDRRIYWVSLSKNPTKLGKINILGDPNECWNFMFNPCFHEFPWHLTVSKEYVFFLFIIYKNHWERKFWRSLKPKRENFLLLDSLGFLWRS